MTSDMRLISIKDGGRFAMTWVAGTSPKALRSNFQRADIYAIDISENCQQIMEFIKSKEGKVSFRVLFKLLFGTIHIFAEQVQHLYCVTQNFVCFNTFVLKQCSLKRASSSVTNNGSKRIRLESSDGLDIQSLLQESEIFNNYTEKNFKFPREIDRGCEKKQNTSTCIQIKHIQEITIRQISWDSPQPDEDDAFGDATQDERMMLLSDLSGPISVHPTRKRKSTTETLDCSQLKKTNYLLNKSIDDIRCPASTYNDSISEYSVDFRNQPSIELSATDRSLCDSIQNNISAAGDVVSQCQMVEDQQSTSQRNTIDVCTPANIPPLNRIPVDLPSNTAKNIPNLSSTDEDVRKKTLLQRKRPRPHLIIDRVVKLPKLDMEMSLENNWQDCYNYDKREHIAPIAKYRPQEDIHVRRPSLPQRLQSTKLLVCFKNCFKTRLMQNVAINRQLILKEILGNECESYKVKFNVNEKEINEGGFKKVASKGKENIKELPTQPIDENNNVSSEIDQNNNSFEQINRNYDSIEQQMAVAPILKCGLDEITPSDISFDFPIEAGTQRSEWGKEGILMKLLYAWKSQDDNINMKTIIVGASRINAALTFHTLLDLAGLHYIEIEKNDTYSIESIKMGPEMIKKLNKIYE